MRRNRRSGFTMIEMLIVCVIVGVLAMLSMPGIRSMRDTYNVQAAKQQLAGAIATARTSAVQKGRPARFRVAGTQISASVDTGAVGSIVVVAPRDLSREFGVALALREGADSVLTYGSRGFRTTPRVGGMQRFVLVRGATRDSVCVGPLGQMLTRGCTS